MIHQTKMMRDPNLGAYDRDVFSPPKFIVVVDALFYASLGVILLAASIAMLIKSWVREFDRGLQALSIPEQRAKTREFRYLGMERWRLAYMVAVLPFLIQISLGLFAVGLVILLSHINPVSFRVTTAIFYYAATTTISVFVTPSPFHSPLSRVLGKIYQHVHPWFVQGLIILVTEYGYHSSNGFWSFGPRHPGFPSENAPLFGDRTRNIDNCSDRV